MILSLICQSGSQKVHESQQIKTANNDGSYVNCNDL